jgi:hypothetical protein
MGGSEVVAISREEAEEIRASYDRVWAMQKDIAVELKQVCADMRRNLGERGKPYEATPEEDDELFQRLNALPDATLIYLALSLYRVFQEFAQDHRMKHLLHSQLAANYTAFERFAPKELHLANRAMEGEDCLEWPNFLSDN